MLSFSVCCTWVLGENGNVGSSFCGQQLSRHRAIVPRNPRIGDDSLCHVRCLESSDIPLEDLKSLTNYQQQLASDVDVTKSIGMLSQKMGRFPTESSIAASTKRRKSSGSKESYQDEQSLRLKQELALYNITDDDDDTNLSSEENAILSLLSDLESEEHNEENDRPQLDASNLTIKDDAYLYNARRSQSDPREVNAVDMKNRLDMVKRRRKKLAAESGEEAMKTLISIAPNDADTLSQGNLYGHDYISRVERQKMKKAAMFTLSRSRIINFEQERVNPNGCALTTCAEQHLRERCRAPKVSRPFVGLLEAFWRVDNPQCPRCKRRTPVSKLQNVANICNTCFSEIYVQSPPGTTSMDLSRGEEFWDKKQVCQEEKRAVEQVKQVLMMSREVKSGQNSGSQSSTSSARASSIDATAGNPLSTKGDMNAGHGMNGGNEPPSSHQPRFNKEWDVQASDRSLRTINPIRNLVQNIDVKPNPDKNVIRLSVGDPTVYGNLRVSDSAIEQYCDLIRSAQVNGYTLSMGAQAARQAVAKRYSTVEAPLTEDDIVLTCGTSGALEIAIGCIANEGDNILLPKPGFPLFRTIAEGFGIECRYYGVNADKQWEMCLDEVPKLVDERTKAIVVNNPSNPCGSVFSASHIDDLVALAGVLRLPIIADEVYADMVFSGNKFTSIGSRSRDVPVLALGGISKQFVVPGWRVGWIMIHDRGNVLSRGDVRKGIRQLTTRMLVPNTPAQHMVARLLEDAEQNAAFKQVMHELEENAKFASDRLGRIDGIRVVKPQGAMYLMAEIEVEKMGVEDDLEFVKELLREESVFVLPGQCFQAKGFVRVVFSAPRDVLARAFDRMEAFCTRRVGQNNVVG
ncbi:Tyrosine aminotransferase [Gracilariopsis chorda]|uniref:Tyrosine aminotransferase n=1 Tax=Gracilariopsis chorda TaxID=448386 RepID=A0A2V3J704_9FLOR|nr:Tyrosine aminotransferase [Gracilariopsis chorda]|eukprot:PXF49777.1 Tyrosine aminotransferase [Gracilariopsis chorda]